jgi:alkaline phosphatase D
MSRLLPCLGLWCAVTLRAADPAPISTAQADLAGEVTQTSVILQSRLTASPSFVRGDLPGAEGVARFEIATKSDFRTASPSIWLHARPENDYIVKTRITQLRPDTLYYYRLVYGSETNATRPGPTAQFKTLPAETSAGEINFVVGQSMNYSFFHYGSDGRGRNAYAGADKGEGYPALEQITYLKPDFMVFAGNAVYYDFPVETRVRSQPLMRQRWHEQFAQPRLIKLLGQIPAYWLMNDHDFRFDDADNSGDRAPSAALGHATYREQLPVIDPGITNAPAYRTHRVNRLLQLWLLDSREARSSNSIPDGPGKSLWGMEQREWLKHGLATSDAAFKIVISPTPLIDPDDTRKSDNHTNPLGFKQEGEDFFAWLRQRNLATNQVYFVAGDRHWQYHTVGATGYEEFGCGHLVNANARPVKHPPEGPAAGGPTRYYVQKREGGGYLHVNVKPQGAKRTPTARFTFYDDAGVELYATERSAEPK